MHRETWNTIHNPQSTADFIFNVNIFLGQLQMFMIYSSTQTNNVDDQAKWKRLDVQTATEFIQAGKTWLFNFRFQKASRLMYNLWTCKKTSSACLKRILVLTFISFHTLTLKNPTIMLLRLKCTSLHEWYTFLTEKQSEIWDSVIYGNISVCASTKTRLIQSCFIHTSGEN